MRAMTYIRYMGLGAMIVGLSLAGVAQEAPQKIPATHTPSAAKTNSDCSDAVWNSAEFQKEMAQMQRRIRERLQDVQARVRQYEAEVAREMSEKGIKPEELASLEARARSSAQRAQQLFAQAPGLIESDEDTGWLGVEMAEVTAEKAKSLNLKSDHGVLVTEVLPDGPAAKAGLQTNDVILEYDDHEVEGTVQFRRLVRETPPRRSVPVTVLRAGQEEKMTIQVGNRVKGLEGEWREATPLTLNVPAQAFNFKMEMPELFMGMTPTLGIEAEDVNGQLGAYFHVPGDDGVLIRSVSAGTPAARAGLKAGDVITRVNGITVTTLAELRSQLRQNREEKTVKLMLMRQGSPVSVTVTLESPETQPAKTRSAAL